MNVLAHMSHPSQGISGRKGDTLARRFTRSPHLGQVFAGIAASKNSQNEDAQAEQNSLGPAPFRRVLNKLLSHTYRYQSKDHHADAEIELHSRSPLLPGKEGRPFGPLTPEEIP